MSRLFEHMRRLVREERYVIGQHVSERLELRGIMEWQAVVGLDRGILLRENDDSEPNPTIEVREMLPDGTEFKAVWARVLQHGIAKLVTVHFYDRG